MNMSTLTGFVVSIGVLVGAVSMTTTSASRFLDVHAALIVVGGTFAAGFVCFSVERIFGLLRVFLMRVIGGRRRDYGALIREIVSVAQADRRSASGSSLTDAVSDPFLRDAAGLLVWREGEITDAQLRDLLEARAETHLGRYTEDAAVFATLARFPPAFGLLGTTLGMIAPLQGIGADGARGSIGPSMSIALVATLYGIVLANFVFIPISEQLKMQAKEDALARRMVVEGVMMIAQSLPVRFIDERLKSHVLPSERATASIDDHERPSQSAA